MFPRGGVYSSAHPLLEGSVCSPGAGAIPFFHTYLENRAVLRRWSYFKLHNSVWQRCVVAQRGESHSRYLKPCLYFNSRRGS